MTSDFVPRIKLVGGMLVSGEDWDMAGFGSLFGTLLTDVKHTGELTRCVRYEGMAADRREVHFFGIEVERIDDIPEGLVGWDIDGDTLTVTRPGNDVKWQCEAHWTWADSSVPGRVLGEFGVQVPAEWSSDGVSRSLEFLLSSNVYVTPGRGDFDDDVHLVDYDPAWPQMFEEAAEKIRQSLGPDLARRIEHYGSTSVPGMPAKPVIDILVEIPSFEDARRRILPAFNTPNCEYWSYSGHMIFIVRQRPMGLRTHHIHMAPAGHDVWRALAFRDYLRTHPSEASRYAALKHDLSQTHKTDRETYTQAKESYVAEVTQKAVEWEGKGT